MSKKKEKSKNYIAEKNLFFLWKLSKILVKKLYMSLRLLELIKYGKKKKS